MDGPSRRPHGTARRPPMPTLARHPVHAPYAAPPGPQPPPVAATLPRPSTGGFGGGFGGGGNGFYAGRTNGAGGTPPPYGDVRLLASGLPVPASVLAAGGRPPPAHVGSGRRALLVGINYRGAKTLPWLEGCVNDVRLMHFLLTSRFGYRSRDMWVMTDEPDGINAPVVRLRPTRRNILNGLHWLSGCAVSGDCLFFHFSGHGGQVQDLDGDEEDGLDETLMPMDFEEVGHIVDDEIHSILVDGLPAGSSLTSVIDTCHSGTVLDLPFIHELPPPPAPASRRRTPTVPNPPAADSLLHMQLPGTAALVLSLVRRRRARQAARSLARANAAGSLAARRTEELRAKLAPSAAELSRRGRVVLFSGCADGQKSEDSGCMSHDGTPTGAMTYAFVEAMEEAGVEWVDEPKGAGDPAARRNGSGGSNLRCVSGARLSHGQVGEGGLTYMDLLKLMREKMVSVGLNQLPQLSSSHPMALSDSFRL
ncbi:hypothetical protein MMPV_001096 [Pyropia vietnamensis]